MHPAERTELRRTKHQLGKNQRCELSSRLTVIIHHLLTWQRQPEQRCGSWRATVVAQRAELERLFWHSPSLRRQLSAAVVEVYRHAARAAAAETDLPVSAFRREYPFTPEQILEDDFFPGALQPLE